jgi:hypothetical protein
MSFEVVSEAPFSADLTERMAASRPPHHDHHRRGFGFVTSSPVVEEASRTARGCLLRRERV